jgi:hypothetical protein
MSWVRLDDGAPGHRKIVGLSDAAFRLWIVGLTHCNQQANDGRFSAHAARIMFGYLASPELGKGAAAELVAADLWAPTDDGYEVRNYLEYQPSKAERDSANKAAAERMRNMRARRYQKPSEPAKPEDVRDPLRGNNEGTSDELPAKFALPDPVPIPSRPDPVPDFKEGTQKPPATPDVSDPQGGFLPGIPAEAGNGGKKQAEPKPKKERKPAKPKDPMPGTLILMAYSEAFVRRHKVDPPLDNRARKHFSNIAKNAIVGRHESVSEAAAIEEACGVAARYVSHPNAYYLQQQHPPGLLDKDWHKLVTEYRTGRTVTATTARDYERTASNPILEFAAEVRAQEEAARRRKAEVVDVEQ